MRGAEEGSECLAEREEALERLKKKV